MFGCGGGWFFGLGFFSVRVGMGRDCFFAHVYVWLGGMRMGNMFEVDLCLVSEVVEQEKSSVLLLLSLRSYIYRRNNAKNA
jgi:hypothetical protein